MNKNKIKIEVTGKNISLFINKLIKLNINYCNLNIIDKYSCTLDIFYNDYINLINEKSIYDIKIIKYYGWYKIYKIVKNNLLTFVFIVLSLIVIRLLSNFCFKIEVVNNNKNIRKLIRNELANNNIREFRFIPKYEVRKKIINNIIKNNERLEWMEIEKKGSKLIVKVIERKKDKTEFNNAPRDIVAKKDGIIKKIEAQNGQIIKYKDDYVKKGDVVISGSILKDDEIKKQIKAKGLVYAEVWYNIKAEYPLDYKETIYLDKESYNIVISNLNKKYKLKRNYENIKLQNKIILLRGNIYPFSMYIEKQQKIIKKEKKLSCNDALYKSKILINDKFNLRLSKEDKILSKKTLNYYCDKSKIYIDMFYKVYENITDYKDIIINN